MNRRQGPIDLSGLRRGSITSRQSKVHVSDAGRPHHPRRTFADFVDSLPKIEAARRLLDLSSAILKARAKDHEVLVMMGAHVVKCGLSPVIADLMTRGLITSIAMNGASAIHDVEMAVWGETSEDVATALENGSFGMTEETAKFMNQVVLAGRREGMGMGEALGRAVETERSGQSLYPSILGTAWNLGLAATVHVAIGTDVIHQHPEADGEATGWTSLRDFHVFCNVVSRLDGGVAMNWGSAVIMPEVFLKALSVARNLGSTLEDLVTANLDMIQHYRPQQNVLARPTAKGGKAISLTGHHEIMIPLLAALLVEKWAK